MTLQKRLWFVSCSSIILLMVSWIFYQNTEFMGPTYEQIHFCNISHSQQILPLKAAIVILVDDRPKRLQSTCDGLQALQKNLILRFRYPILLFHDQKFPLVQKQFLQNCTTAETRFIEINMSPQPLLEDDSVMPLINCSTCSWGYLKMIHFFFVDIFLHPAVRELDFFMRLDSDSAILSPIEYDPFEFMRKNKKHYGFRQRGLTPRLVSMNMWPFVNSFLQAQKVKRKYWPIHTYWLSLFLPSYRIDCSCAAVELLGVESTSSLFL